MLMPSIFGENLFNDDWMDFSFPDVDKALYGKHAKNVMKTDVKETDNSYEVDIDLPGFKKDEIEAKLENGYLTISAAKGLDKEEKEEKDGKYIRKERYSGAMSRSFYVGDEAKNLFMNLWLYASGLATLIATNDIKMDEKEILVKLVRMYKSLVKENNEKN